MPKGAKLHTYNTKYVYCCGTNNTEREFETEQQYDTYLKRHAKMCPCKGIVEVEINTLIDKRNNKEFLIDMMHFENS